MLFIASMNESNKYISQETADHFEQQLPGDDECMVHIVADLIYNNLLITGPEGEHTNFPLFQKHVYCFYLTCQFSCDFLSQPFTVAVINDKRLDPQPTLHIFLVAVKISMFVLMYCDYEIGS